MLHLGLVTTRGARWLCAALVALLLGFAALPAAAQDDAQEIRALLDTWAASYSSPTATAEGMLKLYAADAVFWGTGAQTPFVGAEQIAPYFTRQFTTFPERKVSFIDPVIRSYGDTGTATGLYRFEVTTTAGEHIDVTHRFSFALHRGEGGWLFVQQHSSQMPQ
jgi:uncharacterized protein (TIGR02246 family)